MSAHLEESVWYLCIYKHLKEAILALVKCLVFTERMIIIHQRRDKFFKKKCIKMIIYIYYVSTA